MKTYRIVVWGGFGDALVVTPALRALKEKYPKRKVVLYCAKAKFPLFKNNPFIDKIVALRFFDKPYLSLRYMFSKRQFKYTDLSVYHLGRTTAGSAKHSMGEFLGVKISNPKNEIFLTDKEADWGRDFLKQYPSPRVALHITSECSKNNSWKLEHWNDLVKKHPNTTFIQLGHLHEDCVEGALDLRGKTNLTQALSIMKNVDSFVGVESFFGHVTNAFSTKGVVLFSDSSPRIWGHDNNINLSKQTQCSPCYEVLNGMQCPYNNECRNHTVQEVSEALIKQLSDK